MKNAHLRCWDKVITFYEVWSQVYFKTMDNIFLSIYCLLFLDTEVYFSHFCFNIFSKISLTMYTIFVSEIGL